MKAEQVFFDIIIVGAGISGLFAARELAKAGKKVLLLEAQNRLGGRIFTSSESGFDQELELGAEFIHGDLPITIRLLNEFGIKYHATDGQFYRFAQGRIFQTDDMMEEDHKILWEKLNELGKEDLSVEDFLSKNFPGNRYESLKKSIRGFVINFDAADTSKASTQAFKKEWMEIEEEMFRVEGGYGKIIEALSKEITKCKGQIFLNKVVKEISWKRDEVEVKINDDEKFRSSKLLFTIPVKTFNDNSVLFDPPLTEKKAAASLINIGNAIKVFIQFKTPFWTDETIGLKDLGIITSNEEIPVWWTQNPNSSSHLTGWVAGTDSDKMNDLSEEIFEKALQSLKAIFSLEVGDLKLNVTSWKIINWKNVEYCGNAYSYKSFNEENSREKLGSSVEHTLFFAGESYNTGDQIGTVEAALQSTEKAISEILTY